MDISKDLTGNDNKLKMFRYDRTEEEAKQWIYDWMTVNGSPLQPSAETAYECGYRIGFKDYNDFAKIECESIPEPPYGRDFCTNWRSTHCSVYEPTTEEAYRCGYRDGAKAAVEEGCFDDSENACGCNSDNLILYLDENRADGKPELSYLECEQIRCAWNEGDWETIMSYVMAHMGDNGDSESAIGICSDE